MRYLFTLTILTTTLATAQDRDPQPRTTIIRASGEATVTARADQTRLRLSVVTTGNSAERAREKNAERTTQVIARLRELLGNDADIRTINFTVNQTFANNTIEVGVKDPALSGKVIDVATKAGANVVRGVDPTAQDAPAARTEALKQAALQARTNAEAIAAALGLRMLRIVSAETGAPAPLPNLGSYPLEQHMRVVTPIEPNPVEIRVQVTLTIEVGP